MNNNDAEIIDDKLPAWSEVAKWVDLVKHFDADIGQRLTRIVQMSNEELRCRINDLEIESNRRLEDGDQDDQDYLLLDSYLINYIVKPSILSRMLAAQEVDQYANYHVGNMVYEENRGKFNLDALIEEMVQNDSRYKSVIDNIGVNYDIWLEAYFKRKHDEHCVAMGWKPRDALK